MESTVHKTGHISDSMWTSRGDKFTIRRSREVILQVWYFVESTKEYGIHYTKKGILNIDELGDIKEELEYEDQSLIVFTDADHMGCPFTLRSTGGLCIYLYRNLIGFTTTKQK